MNTSAQSRKLAVLSLVLLVPLPSLSVWMAMVLFPGTVGQVAFFIGAMAFALLPAVWYRWVDHQAWSFSPARQGGFGVALLGGLVMSGVVLIGYQLWGSQLIDEEVIRQAAQKNGIATPLKYGLGVLYWVTINSLKEEYVFRWFMVRQLRKLTTTWSAIVLAGVFFTIHHVLALAIQGFGWPMVVLGGLGVLAGGVFWSWLYVRYQSVWPGYLSHAMVDIAVFGVGWVIIMR